MAKLKLPADPDGATAADAVRLIVALHGCVEQHRKDDKRDHKTVRGEVGKVEGKVEEVRQAIGVDAAGKLVPISDQLEAALMPIRHAIGIDRDGRIVRKTFLNMGQLEFVSKVGGAAAVIVVVIRFAVSAWPFIAGMFGVAWHFILGK